jgi:hypothetical protein
MEAGSRRKSWPYYCGPLLLYGQQASQLFFKARGQIIKIGALMRSALAM